MLPLSNAGAPRHQILFLALSHTIWELLYSSKSKLCYFWILIGQRIYGFAACLIAGLVCMFLVREIE